MSRLPLSSTHKIQPDRPLHFTWQGTQMQGLGGDSVASALYANGVRIISRSLKYHRPRGLYSLDGENANCLVNINGECNVKAEQTPLQDGMRVKAQNCLGAVESDVLGFLDHLDHFMPAGFYYRRFHRPFFLWPFFETVIRKMAGAGRVEPDALPGRGPYQELYPQAEVCVIGGGPAGLSAVLAAAGQGIRVVLFESRPCLGGGWDWRVGVREDHSPYQKVQGLIEQVKRHENIRVFSQAPVIDLCGDGLVSAFQVGNEDDPFEQRYIQVRAKAVVVATGCGERHLVFSHNDRPGVMLPSCAWRLARTYGVMPGRRAVFSVADDLGLEAALDLAGLGLSVAAVADARLHGHDPELVTAISRRGIPFLPGWAASRVCGGKKLCSVTLGRLNEPKSKSWDCDLLAASAGASPVNGPLCTAGAELAFDRHTSFFLPKSLPPGVWPAGRMLGYIQEEAILASGEAAGLKAASYAGARVDTAGAELRLSAAPGPAKGCGIVHGPKLGRGRKAFICFDEDGAVKTAGQCVEMGFDVPEPAKRFGGFGLGPGQGGMPGQNLPMVMAELSGRENLNPTTVRPPLTPVLMSTLAGWHRDIHKRTPMHAEQEALGGEFRRVGVWKRARYFSPDHSCAAELAAIKTSVGLIDVSTLGKFRVFGPDALKILQRVYISNMNRKGPGELKYSAMLNAEGMLLDDGVVIRTGENDYYLTTSTGRAGATTEWLRYHSRYEDWDYHIVNLTDTLAALNLAGPQSRRVLAKLTDFDLSNDAFPFMGYREFKLKGSVPVRALRVGFVGELSYELHFPASFGPMVWQWIMEAGKDYGIRPFGLEAQFICRLEKGHIIIGQETEQRVNLLDLGLGFLWDRKDKSSGKVGAPALKFTESQAGRLKLTGFTLEPGSKRPLDGAVVYDGPDIKGFVCTCRRSPALNKVIGLALVEDYLAREGGTLNIYQNDRNRALRFKARVTRPPFYDPQGLRLKA